uniref:Small ribosomal subunit protein bS16c n=1 Tax=Schizocladia ischiensis TaxID=196139 RepID=A0A7S6UA28_9STRA|nr:ribosomal protein S16 [Schizocladia ischiensis]QOW07571.1 ribosomal protein S16 [Schizocladia ischiensis]
MLKLRLKRCGRKKRPFYRIVVMNNKTKRDGKAIEQLGYYNPITKTFSLNRLRTLERLEQGVIPTQVVKNLLQKADIQIDN